MQTTFVRRIGINESTSWLMLPQNDSDDGIHSWLILQPVNLADVVGWPPVSTWPEAEYDPQIPVDQYPRLVGNRKELRTLT